MNAKDELIKKQIELGILEAVNCTKRETLAYRQLLREGKPLPEGVWAEDDYEDINYANFYYLEKTELTESEVTQYLQCKQLEALLTIKNCMVYFTVLSIISLVCGVIAILLAQ